MAYRTIYTDDGKVLGMVGTAGSRPSPTSVGEGVFYAADDTNDVAFASHTGAGSWVGGGADTLPKYWVAPANSVPAAPFNTLTAAFAAWQTDKAAGKNPGPIFVARGTYNEPAAVTLPVDCDVIGEGSIGWYVNGNLSSFGPVVNVNAQLDYAPAIASTSSVTGVRFNGGALAALVFQSTAVAQLILRACVFESAALGTTDGAPFAGSSLELSDCQFINSNVGNSAAFGFTSAVNITAVDCNILGQAPGNGGISTAGGTHRYQRCTIQGNAADSAAGTRVFQDCESTSGGPFANVLMILGSTVSWSHGSLVGGVAGGTFGGAAPGGTLFLDGPISTDANGIVAAAGIVVNLARSMNVLTSRDNGAVDLTAANCLLADVHTLDIAGAGAALTANLPLRAAVLPGQEYIFCGKVGGAFAIHVHPQAGETVAGVAADADTSATKVQSMRVQADPHSATNWNILSQS